MKLLLLEELKVLVFVAKLMDNDALANLSHCVVSEVASHVSLDYGLDWVCDVFIVNKGTRVQQLDSLGPIEVAGEFSLIHTGLALRKVFWCTLGELDGRHT